MLFSAILSVIKIYSQWVGHIATINYVISALLCVTLNGQILGGWVFVVDVTRGLSVTKGVGLPHS